MENATTQTPFYLMPIDGKVEIRTGQATKQLDPKKPQKINLTGIIQCVGDFVDKRNTCFDPLNAHVIVNYTNKTIKLTMNESDKDLDLEGGTVTGKLDVYPDLAKLGINANKEYTHKELFTALKFMGRFFVEKDAHTSLIKKLMQFNAKVKSTFKDEDDFKGTSAQEKLQEIEHDIPLSFVMDIPLFTGGERKTFKVDICVSVRDGGVSFWMESVELVELSETFTISILEAQIDRLKGYAVIKQW